MSRRIAVFIVVFAVAGIVASPAAAQAVVAQGYSTPASEVQADVSRAGGGSAYERPRAVRAEASSRLPFTGLDVGLLGGVGLGLLLLGAGLSRLTAAAANWRE